jgi:hypothetical protein
MSNWPLKRAHHRAPPRQATPDITIVAATKPKRVKRTSGP